ncbi:MAG: hypothetical protein CFH01_01835 [Alphaproteobacteria bacterium MarineAlpha2_Bin1]|nr:MAG: hypothetical protein CFH01_01835 [Alphaproteobacteria bacterium MarineAlpha2_Bin1]
MVDVRSRVPNPLFLREEDLRQTIELLFFAYRDFTEGPDKILSEVGFGRAHHRVIHFVFRNEGISVTELLKILKITKQSLSRVLTQLVNDKYIDQIQGTKDRRQKKLYLTNKGLLLEKKLSEPQLRKLAEAFRTSGAAAVENYRDVLIKMINEKDRQSVIALIEKSRKNESDVTG